MKPIKFPAKLLAPIKKFLSKEERRLRKRKSELAKQDPFEDERRTSDNAAPDADAAEQVGHERVEAIKKEVERKIIQIRKALTQIKLGKYAICEKCGEMIDTDRLMVIPETTVCVKCEKKKEK
jgi:DnaK suppressor protein